MRRGCRPATALLVAWGLLAAGCGGPDPAADPAGGSTDGSTDPVAGTAAVDTTPAAPTRVALPGLFSIMSGLDRNMHRVSRGLWLGALDSVAVAATAVADHPRVPPDEFERISGILGPEMSRFGGMDRTVHDLAVRLAEEARSGGMDAVLETDARLRSACVRCHTTFRERIREGVR